MKMQKQYLLKPRIQAVMNEVQMEVFPTKFSANFLAAFLLFASR
jgi:hypothetical protein